MNEFLNVAKVADFREAKTRRYFVQGHEIGIATVEGRWYAFSNRCTHNDFQLHFGYIEDAHIHCPIHWAVFDLATGKALEGPLSLTDLSAYAVRVEGEDVQVDLNAPPLPAEIPPAEGPRGWRR